MNPNTPFIDMCRVEWIAQIARQNGPYQVWSERIVETHQPRAGWIYNMIGGPGDFLGLCIHQVADLADSIYGRRQIAAELDAVIDSGEFSAAGHARKGEQDVEELCHLFGVDVDKLHDHMDAEYDAQFETVG